MANVVAQGISRKKIRAFTKYVRELCGMTDRMYFPVVEFLEIILPNLIDDFTYEIVEHSEMPDKEGETIPSLNTIKIREDVYEKATQGDGRALAVWLQNNGIEIIPNVRTADVRTFRFAFKGVESNKTW